MSVVIRHRAVTISLSPTSEGDCVRWGCLRDAEWEIQADGVPLTRLCFPCLREPE